MGNHLDRWEMAQICGEMASLFDKRHKNIDKDLDILERAKIFGNGLDTWGTA